MLYTSFRNKEDSIGLEMLEGLHQLCKTAKNCLFEFHLRLSDTSVKGQQWDAAFIEASLSAEKTNLKKVWVCGPPVMNETFDQAMEGICTKLNLSKDIYEIM